MKPTKVRNQQIYRATYSRRSKQVGSPLSKDLQKKYGKRSIRITLGDTVKVIRGEYRGVDGKVSKIEISGNNIAVEGIKKEKSQGDKVDIFITASNVVVTGLNLDDHWRKTKLEGKKPKTTPKEVKPEKVTEEKPKTITKEVKTEEAKVAPTTKSEETPKKEAKSAKKSEKPKESKPVKKAKSKPTKKEESKE